MKVIIIFCFTLVALVAAVPRNATKRELSREENEFIQNYRIKFRKSIKYTDAKEDRKRADIVLERHANITTQNELFKNGKSTFECGLNSYSYMEFDEFNNVMCGTRPQKQIRTSPALPQTVSKVYPPVPASRALALNWAPTYLMPIVDQGPCGCCWTFAAVAIVESMVKRQIHVNFSTPLSPQQLVDCSKESPNNGCNGGWPSVALEHFKLNGVATLAAYPFNGNGNQTCNKTPTSKFPGQIITKVTQEYVNGNETLLMEILNNAGPVIVVVNVCAGFQTLKTGIYDNPACPNDTFNHAVVLVGYGVENGIPYWIIRNSWGVGWGDQGYGKMIRNKNNQCGIALYATYTSYT